MIENGTLLQNRYLIENQIGAGGMGAVYLAVDQRFGSRVALKETFYKQEELGIAFEREARLLNGLHHPLLPHVSDYFTENKGHFLVMEYIEGQDLSEIIRQQAEAGNQKPFAVSDVLNWTDKLLDALDYLHSHEPPIIHRDIKPQNLKLTPRGDIILLDFGLAKLSQTADHASTSGAPSVFGFSRKYSPLEQIQGTGTDPRSDIFSLGATAFHLLTGKPPVDVLTRAAEIIAGRPDPLELANNINNLISAEVARVLSKALALNAELRFATAEEMRRALKYAANLNSPSADQPPAETADIFQTGNQPPETQNANPVSAETAGNFPALASFAAAAPAPEVLSPTAKDDKSSKILVPIPSAAAAKSGEKSGEKSVTPPAVQFKTPATSAAAAALISSNSNPDVATEISAASAAPPPHRSISGSAVAATALLICAVLAGVYLTDHFSAATTNQTPPATDSQAITDPNSAAQPNALPIANEPSSETNSNTVTPAETSAQTNPAPATKEETAAVPNEETAQPTSKTKKSTVAATTTRSGSAPSTQPKTPAPPREEITRQRRVGDSRDDLPDIESIFTGVSREERAQREAERQERRQRRWRRNQTDEDYPPIQRRRNSSRRP